MQRAQHWTQFFYFLPALFRPLLVAIETGNIESIRTADIETPIAIEVAQLRTLGCVNHGAKVELFAHRAHEGKRHAIGVGKTQIRKAFADLFTPCDGLRTLGLKVLGKAVERLLSELGPSRV